MVLRANCQLFQSFRGRHFAKGEGEGMGIECIYLPIKVSMEPIEYPRRPSPNDS
jgi:hypothetical protein